MDSLAAQFLMGKLHKPEGISLSSFIRTGLFAKCLPRKEAPKPGIIPKKIVW